MAIAQETEPTDPRRVRAFARFFKSYMSVSTVVVAALPIPITQLGGIPTYAAQKPVLTTYTPLFCFLLLGFIFYGRHALARVMFRAELFPEEVRGFHQLSATAIAWLPALLIFMSVSSGLGYVATLNHSLTVVRALKAAAATPVSPDIIIRLKEAVNAEDTFIGWAWRAVRTAPPRSALSFAEETLVNSGEAGKFEDDESLKAVPLRAIPFGGKLMRHYLTMFLTAEAAFVLMAIREYLQDLLALQELDVIRGRASTVAPAQG